MRRRVNGTLYSSYAGDSDVLRTHVLRKSVEHLFESTTAHWSLRVHMVQVTRTVIAVVAQCAVVAKAELGEMATTVVLCISGAVKRLVLDIAKDVGLDEAAWEVTARTVEVRAPARPTVPTP